MYIRFGVSCIALCLGLISACDSMNTRPDIEDESTKVSIADSTFVVAADILSHIGSVVDLDAGKMILGDFVNGDLEQLSGALYVYSRSGNTWIKDATLRSFQAEANLLFWSDG